MIERLELTKKRYDEIQDLLMSPEIVSDIKKSKELSIELSTIEDVVNCYLEYKRVLNDLKDGLVLEGIAEIKQGTSLTIK